MTSEAPATYLNSQQAADLLHLSARTLERMRVRAAPTATLPSLKQAFVSSRRNPASTILIFSSDEYRFRV